MRGPELVGSRRALIMKDFRAWQHPLQKQHWVAANTPHAVLSSSSFCCCARCPSPVTCSFSQKHVLFGMISRKASFPLPTLTCSHLALVASLSARSGLSPSLKPLFSKVIFMTTSKLDTDCLICIGARHRGAQNLASRPRREGGVASGSGWDPCLSTRRNCCWQGKTGLLQPQNLAGTATDQSCERAFKAILLAACTASVLSCALLSAKFSQWSHHYACEQVA